MLAAMLLLGAASGLHCIGMCGGIAAAFSAQGAAAQPVVFHGRSRFWARQLAFNLGRIGSYALAGALAGAAGSAGAYLIGAGDAPAVLLSIASLLVILAGIHLSGVAAPLARLEALGFPLWRRIQPLAARLLGAPALASAFLAGAAWGFIPCGLVYAALAIAVFAASPLNGAAAMAAYGLGTLPWLLAAGVLTARLRSAGPRLRLAAGAGLCAFGVWGLARAGTIGESVAALVGTSGRSLAAALLCF